MATTPNRYNRIHRDTVQNCCGSAVEIGRDDSVAVDVYTGDIIGLCCICRAWGGNVFKAWRLRLLGRLRIG
jgi:hypothetical protein